MWFLGLYILNIAAWSMCGGMCVCPSTHNHSHWDISQDFWVIEYAFIQFYWII